MRKTKLYIQGTLLGVLAVGLLSLSLFSQHPVSAQVPSAQPPFNVDVGAVITNTARAAGTVNSTAQSNLDKEGAICAFNMTATSANNSTQIVLAIQNFDTASGLWYTVVTSTASSPTNNVPIVVMVHDGMQTASLPASIAAAQGVLLSRTWRAQQITTGVGTTTGTVGCNIMK